MPKKTRAVALLAFTGTVSGSESSLPVTEPLQANNKSVVYSQFKNLFLTHTHTQNTAVHRHIYAVSFNIFMRDVESKVIGYINRGNIGDKITDTDNKE